MTTLVEILSFGAAVFVSAGVRCAATAGAAARLPRPAMSVIAEPHGSLRRLGRSALGRRLDGDRPRRAVAVAGWDLDPIAFAGLRVVTAVLGAGGALVMPLPGPLLAPFLAFVGARAPLFMAARAAQRRSAEIDAEIPQLLDLLAAGSSAGLAAPLALMRAADALQGPLVDELRRSLDAVDLGSRWRDELRLLADRLQLPDLARAVSAITRTETLGSSLSDSTVELAAAVRAARRAAVTERARTAPVKMLFPLVFLVLPAFLLLTVVPVLLTTLQSIR
jgi:tight adherence protein C